ncbi:MAG: hypothetical protein QM723_08030 [Myxococcaceae bacterium]
MRRSLLLVLAAASCLPAYHDLTGHPCSADSDCDKLVCHRGVCESPGSVSTLTLAPTDLQRLGSNEGGADLTAGVTRETTLPGLRPFIADTPLSTARSSFAAAEAGGHWYLLGGSSGGSAIAAVTELPALQSSPAVERTVLPSARSGLAATAAGGHVFVLGGRATDGTLLSEVLSAEVAADGTLGAWQTEPSLPSGRASLATVAAGGFVYAIGGQTAAGLSGDLLAAPIHGDGRLGAFAPAGTFPASSGGRAQFGAAVFDRRLYVAAGSCEGGSCSPLRAALLDDGGIGAFEPLPAFPERVGSAVIAAGGSLHVIGGSSNGTTLDEVLSLPLTESGQARWQSQQALPEALESAVALAGSTEVLLAGGVTADGGTSAQTWVAFQMHSGIGAFDDTSGVPKDLELAHAVTWNGAIYLAGNDGNSGPMTEVFRTVVLPDGGLAPWTVAGNLPVKMGDLGLAAWGGRLYVIAGCTASAPNGDCLGSNTTMVADFLGDGGVGTFRMLETLPDELAGPGVTVVGGWLYVIGGVEGYTTNHAEVRVAKIDPSTGDLGPLKTTTPLPSPRWSHATVSAHGMIYVVGGQGGGINGFYDTIIAAQALPDGTVGPWSTVATMPETRGRLSAEVIDDTIYIAGGCNEDFGGDFCSHYPDEVLSTTILADGGLTTPAAVGTVSWARRALASASLGGRYFTIGGYDGNPKGDTQVAPIFARGTIGPPVTQPSLPAPRSSFASAASNGWLFAVGGAEDGRSVLQAPFGGSWMSGPALPVPFARGSSAVLRGRVYVIAAGHISSSVVSGAGLVAWRDEAALPTTAPGSALAASDTSLYLTGGDGSAAVAWATPGADGLISAWAMGPALPSVRTDHRSFVAGGELFVLGGTAPGDVGDALVSALGADGAPGEWRSAGSSSGPKARGAAVSSDGFAYFAGGTGPNGDERGVLASSIHSDGRLGGWSAAGQLPSTTSSGELVSSSGWLVALGGTGSSAVTAYPMLTAPAQGVFAVRADLGHAVSQVESLTLTGAATPGTFVVDARFAGDDGVFGPWVSLGRARVGQDLAVGQGAHFVWLRVTLDDSAGFAGPAPGALRDLAGVTFSLKL